MQRQLQIDSQSGWQRKNTFDVLQRYLYYLPRPALRVGGFLEGAGAETLFTFFSACGASAFSGW
jgi:hypothetical protein